MHRIERLSYFFFLLLMISCDKKEVGPQTIYPVSPVVSSSHRKLYVGCEGLFNSGWASVTMYDLEEATAYPSYYNSVNGQNMGNVLQSMTQIEDAYFLVVNNSEKIVVVDTAGFSLQGEIQLKNRSPRYIIDGGNGQSFVSNLALNPGGNPVYIDVVDNQSLLVVDSINVGLWTEEMVVKDDKLYACVMRGSALAVIDVNSHEIISTINVGVEPTSIVMDANGMLWVLCTGGFSEELPTLWRINTNTLTSEVLQFNDVDSYPTHLVLNGDGDQLYFLNDGVYTMSINDIQLPSIALIEEDITYYGLSVDPENEEIFVADANGFDGAGTVFRYNSIGEWVDEFEVGVLPSSFLFE